MIQVVSLETPELGDRSYVVTDGVVAVVVDPQRDIDRLIALVARLGTAVTHVVETHIHNDYVSGGLELARVTGAGYVIPGDELVGFATERVAARDGYVITTGGIELTAMHTPGHTPHHLAWALRESGFSRVIGVFSGGSLLFGSAGRTDLSGGDRTDALARAQWRSLRRLGRLEAEATLHPTHGFGSFCSAWSTMVRSHSTIGEERALNPGLRLDEDAFVGWLVDSFTEFPAYYAHMGNTNRRGPAPVDISPLRQADASEVAQRIAAGEWVVDLRACRRFASHHLAGTINVELGLQFATYVGWTMPYGTPITLLGDSAATVATAQRALTRIGIDRPAAQATSGPMRLAAGRGTGSFPVARFGDLSRAGSADAVIDVRRRDEWRRGHLGAALHVPLHELVPRLGEIPQRRLWVHCAAGMRASIGASLLAAAGHDVVLVDDRWPPVDGAGLAVVGEEAPVAV